MAATKHEWRKAEKSLYLPPAKPVLVTVEPQNFITVTGSGNPNGQDFAVKTETLYTLAYAVRMLPKKQITPPGYFEYTVYPLEGLWDSDSADPTDKDAFKYKIMIRQPNFVTQSVFTTALTIAAAKKPGLDFSRVELETITDGLCVQMTHVGPYDDEPASFALMASFAQNNGLTRIDKTHREIYLSDPRKTQPAKTKTLLRFKVKAA